MIKNAMILAAREKQTLAYHRPNKKMTYFSIPSIIPLIALLAALKTPPSI